MTSEHSCVNGDVLISYFILILHIYNHTESIRTLLFVFNMDFKNQYQWEPYEKTEINQFIDAGSVITRGIKFIPNQPSPLRT